MTEFDTLGQSNLEAVAPEGSNKIALTSSMFLLSVPLSVETEKIPTNAIPTVSEKKETKFVSNDTLYAQIDEETTEVLRQFLGGQLPPLKHEIAVQDRAFIAELEKMITHPLEREYMEIYREMMGGELPDFSYAPCFDHCREELMAMKKRLRQP